MTLIGDKSKEAAMKQQAAIDSDRIEQGIEPVLLHHMPNWMRKRINRVLGVKHSTAGWAAAMQLQPWAGGLMDHWGSAVIGNREALVFEPYADAERCEHIGAMIASKLRCDYEVSDRSWWYPGQTMRIAFFEK